jgi:hypothetical protein
VAEGECKREEVVEITVGGEDLDMVVEAFAGGTGGLEVLRGVDVEKRETP